jgi:hypothetical protein
VLHTRAWQVLLIVAALGLAWLLMLAAHEFGHVLHAWFSGGTVQGVVLHPLAISRTDVAPNPCPHLVAWGGVLWGSLLPLAALGVGAILVPQCRPLLAFFAGFCCIANGLYLAAGSLTGAGDAGDIMRYGAQTWHLVVFGLPPVFLGLWLWNGVGPTFGFGAANGVVDRKLALSLAIAFCILAILTAVLSAG